MFAGVVKIHFFLVEQPLKHLGWGTLDWGFNALAFFSIIVPKQLPPFLTSLWPRNDSLLMITVEVTLLPYPKLLSV